MSLLRHWVSLPTRTRSCDVSPRRRRSNTCLQVGHASDRHRFHVTMAWHGMAWHGCSRRTYRCRRSSGPTVLPWWHLQGTRMEVQNPSNRNSTDWIPTTEGTDAIQDRFRTNWWKEFLSRIFSQMPLIRSVGTRGKCDKQLCIGTHGTILGFCLERWTRYLWRGWNKLCSGSIWKTHSLEPKLMKIACKTETKNGTAMVEWIPQNPHPVSHSDVAWRCRYQITARNHGTSHTAVLSSDHARWSTRNVQHQTYQRPHQRVLRRKQWSSCGKPVLQISHDCNPPFLQKQQENFGNFATATCCN